MPPRNERLLQDHEKILRVFDSQSLVRIIKIKGEPPDYYVLEYQIKTLTLTTRREVIKISSPHVEISLPETYPHEMPQCIILAPVFHPNMSEIVDVKPVWEATGDLCELILYIGELLSYQKYDLTDPLNPKAAKWANKKTDIFPVDPSPLVADPRWRERERVFTRGEELCQRGAYRKAIEEWESDPELSDHPTIRQRIARAREELHRLEKVIQEAEEELSSGHPQRALELLGPLDPTARGDEGFCAVLEKARSSVHDQEEQREKAFALMEEGRAFLEKGDIQGAQNIAENIELILSGQSAFQEFLATLRHAVEEKEKAHRQKALQDMEQARGLLNQDKEEEALHILEDMETQLKGDSSFEELIHSARQRLEEKMTRRFHALKDMEEIRQEFLSGDPEGALPRIEALQPVIGEEISYQELLEAIREGIMEREALRTEIAASLEEAAAHLEAGLEERALAALSSIAPYCAGNTRFDALKSAAEEKLHSKQMAQEVERSKSVASRLFDTGQIHEALNEYQNLSRLAPDEAIHDEIDRILEWRFHVKLKGARERLKSLDVELAKTHLHYASLITPVAKGRESDLKALCMEIERAERILSHKREAERLYAEKKIEAATQEWRKILSIDPDNAEAQQAIARLWRIAHHKEVVAHASRVGLYIFLALFAVVAAMGLYYVLENQNLRDAASLIEKRDYKMVLRTIEEASPPPLLTRTQMRELRGEALYALSMAEGDHFAQSNQWDKALRSYAQAMSTGGQRGNSKQKILAISRAQIGQAEEWAAQGKLEQADQLLEAMVQALSVEEKLRSRAVEDRVAVLLKLSDQYMKNRLWADASRAVRALQSLSPREPETVRVSDLLQQTINGRLQEIDRQGDEIHRKKDRYAIDSARFKEQMNSDGAHLADKETDLKSLETRNLNEARLAVEIRSLKNELGQHSAELDQHRTTVKTIEDRIQLQGEAYLSSTQYQQVDKPAYEVSQQRGRELFHLIQEKSDKIRTIEERIKDFIQEQQRLQKALDGIKQEIASKQKRIGEMEKFLAEVDSLEQSLEKEKSLLMKIQKEISPAPRS